MDQKTSPKKGYHESVVLCSSNITLMFKVVQLTFYSIQFSSIQT